MLGRTALQHVHNHHALRGPLGRHHAKSFGQFPIQGLDDSANKASINFAFGNQLGGNRAHHVGGYGKSNTDIAPRGRKYGGIDPHQAATQIH